MMTHVYAVRETGCHLVAAIVSDRYAAHLLATGRTILLATEEELVAIARRRNRSLYVVHAAAKPAERTLSGGSRGADRKRGRLAVGVLEAAVRIEQFARRKLGSRIQNLQVRLHCGKVLLSGACDSLEGRHLAQAEAVARMQGHPWIDRVRLCADRVATNPIRTERSE